MSNVESSRCQFMIISSAAIYECIRAATSVTANALRETRKDRAFYIPGTFLQ